MLVMDPGATLLRFKSATNYVRGIHVLWLSGAATAPRIPKSRVLSSSLCLKKEHLGGPDSRTG
jgi:hypothetical protein